MRSEDEAGGCYCRAEKIKRCDSLDMYPSITKRKRHVPRVRVRGSNGDCDCDDQMRLEKTATEENLKKLFFSNFKVRASEVGLCDCDWLESDRDSESPPHDIN